MRVKAGMPHKISRAPIFTAMVAGRSAHCRIPLLGAFSIAGLLSAIALLVGPATAAEEYEAIERRLGNSTQYLASDELQGRGVGTKGLDAAAEFIVSQFAAAGLNTEVFDGSPFQKFAMITKAQIGDRNEAALVGPGEKDDGTPERIELKLDADFSPMSMSGSGVFDLPLVFVGYGITTQDGKYDDYAGVDVTGKAVVVLRHEPQQADPSSPFDGTKISEYAPFQRKIANASEHSAAGVVFVTDDFDTKRSVDRSRKRWMAALDSVAEQYAEFKEIEEPSPDEIERQRLCIDELARQVMLLSERLRDAYDPVLPFAAGGPGLQTRDFSVVHCRRSAIDEVVKAALDTDLASIECRIDEGPAPHSRALGDWRISGEIEVDRSEAELKNVAAVLEGSGPLSDEVLVIGAHYDHLGFGGYGSLEPKKRAIHNGADDNASGVAVLLEVARTLAGREKKLRRTVVFVAFTAEESGLIGSSHYVGNPVFPIDKTVAMINLDMVGRLRDDKLIVSGSGTATTFDELLDQCGTRYGLKLTKKAGGYGPSDHVSFYSKKVPVMHYFTGTHQQYHRPSDDFEHLNISGMRRIGALVSDVVVALADADARPEYVAVPRRRAETSDDRPYFGSIPDFASDASGYAISGTSEGGPAQRAGLVGGDAIVQFGESKIDNLEDFDSALRKHEGGDRVRVVVLRDGEELTFEVTLDPPR